MARCPDFSAIVQPVGYRLLAAILLIYLFTAKGYIEVADTFSSLETANSIVTRGRLDIDRSDGATLLAKSGLSYSKYGIGLPLVYVPVVAVSQQLGRVAKLPGTEIAGFLISFLNIPFTLLALVAFGKILQRWGTSDRYIKLLVAALAFGTLTWRYAVYDFSEALQGCLILLTLLGVTTGRLRGCTLAGVSYGLLICIKLVHLSLLPIFLLYLFATRDDTRARLGHVAGFLLPTLVCIVLVALTNQARFGNPLESGYGPEARQFHFNQISSTLPRLLVSTAKGLFVFCPILMLALAGWPALLRRYPREAILCAAILLANLLLTSAWHAWEGGWCWGPRLLVPFLPIWFLPAGLAFSGNPSRRQLRGIAAFALVSVIMQVAGVLVKDQEIHHVRAILSTNLERRAFPPDSVAAWVFLKHKLSGLDEIYASSDFGISGDRVFDLTTYPTFAGINIWTEHVARRFHLPILRWLPLCAFLTIGFLATGPARSLARGS